MLSDLARLESGHTPSRRHPEYWEGNIPWVSIRDAKIYHGGLIERTAESINDLGLANSSARLIPAGAVCLSRTASVGYVVVTAKPMATSQDFVNWVCGPLLEPKFLQYLFLSEGEEILRFASGAVHQTIYFPEAKAFSVCVPDVEGQRRIIAILDEAFEGIAVAKANAEKGRRNARDAFESDLQKVFTDCGHDWVSSTIDKHIDFIDYRGKTPEKTSEGLRLITAKNVKKGFIQSEPMEFVAPESYDSWMTRGIPKVGDVLFTTEAPLGNVAQLDTEERVVFAQRVIIMQADPQVLDSAFLKYMLLSAPVQARIHEKATGATALGIKASLLKRIEIAFPRDVAEQKLIVKRLDALAEESGRLEGVYARKLAALEELKRSLLSQAFSGNL